MAHLFETKASTPGEFKVNIFSPDGKTIATTADINAENPTQEISVEGYNNDALKFQIEGLVHNDAQALVQISLTMEALNPYINSMKLVCHDVNSQKTVSQDFTTNNFFVRGGKFIFNTPNGTADDAWFSFENLQSQYCDNSYYDGKGNGKSRFNFVGSQYWDEDGGGAKLYGDNYNPGADYTRKVYVDVAEPKNSSSATSTCLQTTSPTQRRGIWKNTLSPLRNT